MNVLKNLRNAITKGVTKIRSERGLTQAGFARLLGLSQQRFSEIERGKGSITAEQLLFILQYFNLSLSYFVKLNNAEEDLTLQNALARLGAKYLRENPEIFVPEKLNDANNAIVETIATSPSARLISALAPVIVRNHTKLNFNLLRNKLYERGLEQRFEWIIDGTFNALEERLFDFLPKDLDFLYRRASALLDRKKSTPSFFFLKKDPIEDEVDPGLISEKTVQQIKSNRDDLAKKWHVVTKISQKDFTNALKDSE